MKDSIPDELARPVSTPPQKAAAPLRPAPPRLGPFRVSLPALVVQEATRRGIDAIALSSCYAGPRAKSGLVLGFGGASERRIAVAGRTLGEVLHAGMRI